MHCAFPDLVWARLRINADGTAEVLGSGGKEIFPSQDEARSYLFEDEYAPLEWLREHEDEDTFLRERLGRSLREISPPVAASEPGLISRMVSRSR